MVKPDKVAPATPYSSSGEQPAHTLIDGNGYVMQRNESGELVSTDRHISEQHKPVDRDDSSDDLTLLMVDPEKKSSAVGGGPLGELA